MSRQILTRTQLREELDKLFEARISYLKDQRERIERYPDRNSEIQKRKFAFTSYRLAIAVKAQQQLQELIKKHVKK